jgi:L-lysine 6-transaminase
MRSIARSSKFDIKVDFSKSHESYLFDKNTDRELLDFFGMYASLPLGYNHPIFKSDEFIEEYLRVASFKINNCEFTSDETLEFDRDFKRYAGVDIFEHFHYSCTGALAVEAAIKTCIDYKRHTSPLILSFDNSFHGINSYGGFVTSRFPGADTRLDGYPSVFSKKIPCNLENVEEEMRTGKITCVLVEPIQCSAGDIYHDNQFFNGLRTLCNVYDVPLVFDEIQIGFGGTGKVWYFQHLDIVPDIVIFGKKTQLSGIMAQEKYGEIFNPKNSIRLEVTWDGDVADMVRCKYIIKAYKENNILDNVQKRGKQLIKGLSEIEQLSNLRNCGLIVGFDLSNTEKRDILVNESYKNGLICNKTGQKSIRFRPNLNISDIEIGLALEIIKETINKC